VGQEGVADSLVATHSRWRIILPWPCKLQQESTQHFACMTLQFLLTGLATGAKMQH
jgi:hypothetical protein